MNFVKSIVAGALLLGASLAHALDVYMYSPTAFAAAQQANQTVALHFHADWCPTCRAQAETLEGLKSDASLKGVTVFRVVYDNEKALRKELKVRSQSVMIVYKGTAERTRLAGETSADAIKAALKAGL